MTKINHEDFGIGEVIETTDAGISVLFAHGVEFVELDEVAAKDWSAEHARATERAYKKANKKKDAAEAAKKAKKNESFELDEANLPVSKIQKMVDDGKSMDVIVGTFANKLTTNTDEIRRVVKDHMWKKRMKKESVEHVNEARGKLNAKGEIEMTAKNYAKVHKDYKTKMQGVPYAMQIDPKTGASALFPVKIIKESVDKTPNLTNTDKIKIMIDGKTYARTKGIKGLRSQVGMLVGFPDDSKTTVDVTSKLMKRQDAKIKYKGKDVTLSVDIVESVEHVNEAYETVAEVEKQVFEPYNQYMTNIRSALKNMWEAKQDKHTAGATAPEEIDSKESPKSKEFAAKHNAGDAEVILDVKDSHENSKGVAANNKKATPRTGDQYKQR